MKSADDDFETIARALELDYAERVNEAIKGLLEDSAQLLASSRLYLPWHPVRAARLRRKVWQIHVRVCRLQVRVEEVQERRRGAHSYMSTEDL